MLLTETPCRLSPSQGWRYKGGRGRKHEERLGLHSLRGAVSGPWGIISTDLCDYISSCKYSSLKEELTLWPRLPPPTAARADKVAEEAASQSFFLLRKKAVGECLFHDKNYLLSTPSHPQDPQQTTPQPTQPRATAPISWTENNIRRMALAIPQNSNQKGIVEGARRGPRPLRLPHTLHPPENIVPIELGCLFSTPLQ